MRVQVEKRKWPRRVVSSWTAEPIARDRWGQWLWSPGGSEHRTIEGNFIRVPDPGAVQLLADDRWWGAWWWGHTRDITVDVSMPAQFDGECWSYLDLEIDFCLAADNRLFRVDDDEFEALARTGLPEDIRVRALGSAAELEVLLRDRAEPFASVGWAQLDHAVARAKN